MKMTLSDDRILNLYMKEIAKIPLLNRAEEDSAARKAKAGDQKARNTLVKSNLRFVVSIAKKYRGKGLPLEDLISEGNVGLLEAVKGYDPDQGFHFISYAVWWIRRAILKALSEQVRPIRLPMNWAGDLGQIQKAQAILEEQSSRPATVEGIAGMLNMKKSHVAEVLAAARDPLSLDEPVEGKDGHSANDDPIGSFVEDAAQGNSPEKKALESALREDITKLLNECLEAKEAAILCSRFGLKDQAPLSLLATGRRFNLSKERIHQIEKRSIERLQNAAHQRQLEAYVAA
jgi:RNA polymerase primary sigma factor